MKLPRVAVIVMVGLFSSLCCFADTTASFGNNDGIFSAPSSLGPLSLNGSFLTQISGLAPIVANQADVFNPAIDNCATTGCLGSVSLTTGPYLSGTPLVNLTGGPTGTVDSVFGPGGTFHVAGSGFVFNGTFGGATWTCATPPCNGTAVGQWFLNAPLASGTLTVGGTTYTILAGGTVQLTTAGKPTVTRTGGTITYITWNDSGGTTSFPSPVPEPGTLTLLGSGLVAIGLFARKRSAKKAISSL